MYQDTLGHTVGIALPAAFATTPRDVIVARPLRIGSWLDAVNAGMFYRGTDPLSALERRGHQIVRIELIDKQLEIAPLLSCDVVHVYRHHTAELAHVMIRHLVSNRVAVVWDVDDDYGSLPDHSPAVLQYGREATDRTYRSMLTTARLSTVMTTPSNVLAQIYRQAGVGRVVVVPNAVTDAQRERAPHDGVVVGWIAGSEHTSDASQLGMSAVMRQLVEEEPDVRVECIGVDLALPTRYRNDRSVPFEQLPSRMATWDIGIAPLADTAFNRARSDIKVKEYGASGVPWLASDLAPYAHLGPEQGGRLVANDQWLAELRRLVRDEPARQALAERARAWAATETTDVIAERWERVYREAMVAVRGSRPKPRRAKQRARR